MTNYIKKPTNDNHCIEQAWHFSLPHGHPNLWQNVLCNTPTEKWSPDTPFTKDAFPGTPKNKPTTLIEYWMAMPGSEWLEFLTAITESYPNINQEIALRAILIGMRSIPSHEQGQAAGNEPCSLLMIKAYENSWTADQQIKDALLCQAISNQFYDCAEFLIKNGAEPQKAIQIVRCYAGYELLVKHGANPLAIATKDSRLSLPQELLSLLTLNKKELTEPQPNDTVFQNLIWRTSSYKNGTERAAVLNAICKLKITALKTEQPDSPKIQAEFFDMLKRSQKTSDIVSIIRSFDIQKCWNWTTYDDGAQINTLMFLAKYSDLGGVFKQFKKNIPSEVLSFSDSLGRGILEFSVCRSSGGQWDYSQSLYDKINNSKSLDAEAIVRILAYRCANKKTLSRCPNFIENQKNYLDGNYFDAPLNTLISRPLFWECIHTYNAKHGDKWAEFIVDYAYYNISQSSFSEKCRIESLNEWSETINSMPQEIIDSSERLGHLLFAINFAKISTRNFPNVEPHGEHSKNEIKALVDNMISRNVKMETFFTPKRRFEDNSSAYADENKLFISELSAYIEKKKLTAHAPKTIPKQQNAL